MIESLVGVLLLASIVLCSVSSFVIGKNTTQLSKRRFVVSNLLREDIENFVANDYATIAPGSVATNININDGVGTFAAAKTLTCTLGSGVLITDVYGYKKVYGIITWLGGASGTRTLREEMVMYVTKK